MVEIVLEQLLELGKLGLGRVGHVALGLGHLLELAQPLLAHLVVVETLGVDKPLELVEYRVGDGKLGSRRNAGVLGSILGGEIKGPIVAHNVVDQPVELGIGNLDVGRDAAAVAHLAAVGRVIHGGEAVGYALGLAVGVAVRVVNFLDEAAAGYVILGHSHLEHSVEGQLPRLLHKSLAKRAGAHHHGAVQVLQGTSRDLAGAGRAAVDHHHQRHGGCNGIFGRLVGLEVQRVAPFGLKHLGAFWHKEAYHFHRLVDQAAAIAAQVEHQAFHSRVLLQGLDGGLHLLGRVLVVGGDIDVAQVAMRHAIVGHGVHLYLLARDGEGLHAVTHIGAHHRELELRVGLPLQALAHLPVFPLGGRVAVDGHDAVARLEARLGRRAALVGLAYAHARAVVARHDIGPYAAILARRYHHKVVLIFGRDILGVGVDVVEHAVDGRRYGLLGIERVDIEGVQLLVDRVEYIQVAYHCSVIALLLRLARDGRRSRQPYGQGCKSQVS